MALSVQSLVGSLTGYRRLLRDGFIPNESELQQGCTQSSAALDSLFVRRRRPRPRRLAHSALSDVPAHGRCVTLMCFSGGMRILQVNTWGLRNHPPETDDRGRAVATDC